MRAKCRPSSVARALAAVTALAAIAATVSACKRKHVEVEAVTELAYPTCADAGASGDGSAASVVAHGNLRSGPTMREKTIVESFALTEESCRYVMTSREEWPLMAADVEVVYDAALVPLRAWKRMTIPGSPRPDGHADIRRYEMRTPDVTIKRRTPDGEVKLEVLRVGGKTAAVPGAKPMAVIGPSRGLLTAWIKRAKLAPGQKVRELVLDFREMIERLEEVTLARTDDLFEPSFGRNVRVYTIYGREAVFTDEDDVVIGDLQGLRPSESLATPEPPPLPRYGEPDPVGTP